MEYKYVKCPICGSNDIKATSQKAIDKDLIFEYKCNSCDSVFSSETLLKKDREKNKILELEIDNIKSEFSSIKNELNKIPKKAQNLYNESIKSVCEIICESNDSISTGTGIVVNSCTIITNAHVLNGVNKIKDNKCCAIFRNGKKYELSIVKYDLNIDIAVLKSSNDFKEIIKVRKTEIETGENCFTIGNAKGQGLCIFNGIIADKERIVNNHQYIMFTAPVTNGNSGGPLLDSDGFLIGVVRMGRTDATAMNYAIPVKEVANYLKDVE